MGIIGSGWKDEPTNEEQYKDITGEEHLDGDLNKRIDRKLDDNYTSKEERKKLLDLQQKMNNNQ